MIGGRVVDAAAILSLVRSDTIYGAAFLAAANDVGIVLALPAAALHEAWGMVTEAERPFVELLVGLPLAVVDPLDAVAAQRSGTLSATTVTTHSWDAAAAHTVQVSRDRGWLVLTADPTRLRAVDAAVRVEVLPVG